jgi:tetratricopeptide (TPR) repeat protein
MENAATGNTSSQHSLAVELPIYVLVFFTPLAFGTVNLWSICIMVGLSIAAYSALVVRRFFNNHQTSFLAFPMGLALGLVTLLACIQVLPVPPFVVRLLNPKAAELYDYVLSGTGLWGDGQWLSLSLDPPANALELMKFISYTLAFFTVVNYFNDRQRARRLMKVLVWAGFAVTLIGFFFKLFDVNSIFGVHQISPGTFFFSTFVNPNHLAGFLGLCAPVALGLSFSARERQDRAFYGFFGLIMGVGVFMSLSRGGIVAFSAGMIFLIFFAATRRTRQLRHAVLVQVIAAGVLTVAGYLAYDTILKEMKTLGNIDAVREDMKFQAWKGTMPMILDHPIVGIGRGAFASVYPRYKSVVAEATFTHPENEVIQNLVEWGPIFGGMFLLIFAGTVFMSLYRARESFSMGGCLAGVFVVSLHNLVDFNLETGGVAMPFILILSMLCASPFSHAGGPLAFETRLRIPKWFATVLVPSALAIGILAAPFAGTHALERKTQEILAQADTGAAEPCVGGALGEAACNLLRHHPGDYLAPLIVGKAFLDAKPPVLDKAVHWLARALYLNPGSAVGHHLIGRALLFAGSREQALSEYQASAEADRTQLTNLISEVLTLTGNTDAAIRITPQDADGLLSTARILRTLDKVDAAITACRKATELNVTRVDILDLLAELFLSQGQLDDAAETAQKLIDIEPQHDYGYLVEGRALLAKGETEKAVKVWQTGFEQAPESIPLAFQLTEFYLKNTKITEAEDIAKRLYALAPTDDNSQSQINYLLGHIQEARGAFVEARRYYRVAASLMPNAPSNLHNVARMEERIGNWEEAERIYKQLLLENYQPKEIQARLEEISKIRQAEKDQALWDTWVKDKSKKKSKDKDTGQENPDPTD